MRGIALDGERGVAWMAPDELLVMVPLAEAGATLRALEEGLAGEFATAADVSHARAVFRVTGRHWRDVLAKLCPVDFAPVAFLPGEIRRTRAAQVAVAIWMSGEHEVTLVCFRSVRNTCSICSPPRRGRAAMSGSTGPIMSSGRTTRSKVSPSTKPSLDRLLAQGGAVLVGGLGDGGGVVIADGRARAR
jgi:heterotetrameric sarcosine oxidase gamma subunit